MAIGTGIYVWYMYQTVTRSLEEEGTQTVLEDRVAPATTSVEEETSVPVVASHEPAETQAAPITVDATALTSTQREILKSFGYTGDSITITQATVVCAEDAVGSERFAQILNGAAPTPLEAVRMLPCMKQ